MLHVWVLWTLRVNVGDEGSLRYGVHMLTRICVTVYTCVAAYTYAYVNYIHINKELNT